MPKQLLLYFRSGFGRLVSLGCLDLASVRFVSCCRHVFRSVGFVHSRLGLMVAAIRTYQSCAAEQGGDTQRYDEGKQSLHVGLLLCIDWPLDLVPHVVKPSAHPAKLG